MFDLDFDREKAINAILSGTEVAKAIKAATFVKTDPPKMEYRRSYIVKSRSATDIPSAECVGKHLKNIEKPTREDVERAFQEC